jgi:hypothetical protein
MHSTLTHGPDIVVAPKPPSTLGEAPPPVAVSERHDPVPQQRKIKKPEPGK